MLAKVPPYIKKPPSQELKNPNQYLEKSATDRNIKKRQVIKNTQTPLFTHSTPLFSLKIKSFIFLVVF